MHNFNGLPSRVALELRGVPGLNRTRSAQLVGFGAVSIESAADSAVAQAKKLVAAAKKTAEDSPFLFSKNTVAIANVKKLEDQISVWAGSHRQWAVAGKKSTTGSAYTWADWAKEGKELTDAASYQAGVAADSSFLNVVKNTIQTTASQVKSGVVAAATATYSALPYVGIAVASLGALWLFLTFRKQAHLNGLEGARRPHAKRRRSRKGKR